MTKQTELDDLHWELSRLYVNKSRDYQLIEDYWIEIEAGEAELGVTG